jgi:beta-ureidopropionase / N-carbamoyl-L-amino-acid hydrolase
MIALTTLVKINSERLRHDLDELAQIGETVEGGISRLALSNEDLEARAWFASRVEDAGLMVRDDEVGNLSGIFSSESPDAKTLLVGSHLDSVPSGGRYDGSVGVLAGLECLRTIKEAGISLPFHLEIVDFTDQEGNWQSFFGSMGLTGTLRDIQVNDLRQDTAAFRAALFRAGIHPNEVYQARRDPETLAGYLELHIEQGDRLDSAGMDTGIVTRIVGRTTYRVTFYGESTHAATTRREKRRDALQAAAQFITRMYDLLDDYPEGIFNCGDVHVKPGAFNVIPSEAALRVECRHPDEKILSEMEERLVGLAAACAQRYNLHATASVVMHRPGAVMAEPLIETIEQVCDELGCTHQRMISVAGHDAQVMGAFTPSALIFIPSRDGIAHNPREFTEWQHIEKGTTLLLQTILRLAHHA